MEILDTWPETTAEHLDACRQMIAPAPETSGVYYFMNARDYPLYIGKSVNLKQRLLSHFYAIKTDASEANLFHQTQRIIWEETAGELGALLLENYQIKQKQPLFNKRQRRVKKLFTLSAVDDNYLEIKVIPFNLDTTQSQHVYGLFKSMHQAKESCRQLLKQHQLCEYSLSGFARQSRPCFSHQIKICCGPCAQTISVHDYNLQAKQALEHLGYITWPFAGKIAIREISPLTGHAQYHIIDNWVYLQTNQEPKFDPKKVLNDRLSFDKDYYLALLRFLKNTPMMDVIELTET